MKKAIVVLLVFLSLALDACATQTAVIQPPTGTQPVPSATPTEQFRRRRTPTPEPPTSTPAPLRATDTPTPSLTPYPIGVYKITAAYAQDGGNETKDAEIYTATETDQSAIYVNNSGKLTLTFADITTSGNTSSQDNSSFFGLNAAVLAAGGSTISLSDSTIATSGKGANGVFATDAGSSVTLSNVTIQAGADGGHGVMATNGGSLTLTNVDINTAGGSSAGIATDRGGGTIKVTGGSVVTSGQNSPDIYSTGAISVTGGAMRATGAEAAVIEGSNSITLTNTSLFSTLEKWGVMIYQSMSGDAEGAKGVFSMTGGSLAYTPSRGPLFYVTNTTGVITLKEVVLSSASQVLVKASAGEWGSSGSNGGTVIFTANKQTLNGDLLADDLSSITLDLQHGSVLTGAINPDHTAKSVHLILSVSHTNEKPDVTTSTWYVTADSYLTCLDDVGGVFETVVANITGNGHTVYYDASACPVLHGRTYSLYGGGYMKPAD
jgi:hypothetical protein